MEQLNRDKTFNDGLSLLSLSLLFSINPWLIPITFFFIIYGIRQIVKDSEKTNKKKILGILIPFLCWLPLTVIFYELYMKDKI